jgi:hypothetical protein
MLGVERPGGAVNNPPATTAQKAKSVLSFWAFGACNRENCALNLYIASVAERVETIGGMILTEETEVLGEKHYTASVVDE